LERLNPDDYFRVAVELLGEQGSESLTIAALCERLGVTKGSFYHHFGSMPAFVAALLRYWETTHHDRLIALARVEPDPRRRVFMLVDLAVALPQAAEAAIRAWGRSNAEVASAQARVDGSRESHVAETLEALGFPPDRVRLFARMSLILLIGAQQRDPGDLRLFREMFHEMGRLILLDLYPDLRAQLDAALDAIPGEQ
jgi:AcrR family transcriptional regulator